MRPRLSQLRGVVILNQHRCAQVIVDPATNLIDSGCDRSGRVPIPKNAIDVELLSAGLARLLRSEASSRSYKAFHFQGWCGLPHERRRSQHPSKTHATARPVTMCTVSRAPTTARKWDHDARARRVRVETPQSCRVTSGPERDRFFGSIRHASPGLPGGGGAGSAGDSGPSVTGARRCSSCDRSPSSAAARR